VSAEPQIWMKKARPNELALELSVHEDCPLPAHELDRMIQRVFHRYWIERTRPRAGEPFLRFDIWCEQDLLYRYAIVADYAQYDDPYSASRSLGPIYEAAGAASFGGIDRQVESLTQQALSDHIVANFEL